MQPAQRLELGHHVLGDLTRVEGIAPALGDAAQRPAERGQVHDLASSRDPPILEKMLAGAGMPPQLFVRHRPIRSDAGGHDKPVLGKCDRGRQHLAQRPRTVVGEQPRPSVDGAWNGDGVRTLHLDLRDALAREPVGGCGGRGAAGSAKADRLLSRP